MLIGNCINNLNTLSQNNQVTLMWVPGHSDIEGNEEADTLAKTGAHKEWELPEPAIPVSYRRCRLAVRWWIESEHDKIWKQMNTCLHTKNIIRTSDKIPSKSLLNLVAIGFTKCYKSSPVMETWPNIGTKWVRHSHLYAQSAKKQRTHPNIMLENALLIYNPGFLILDITKLN